MVSLLLAPAPQCPAVPRPEVVLQSTSSQTQLMLRTPRASAVCDSCTWSQRMGSRRVDMGSCPAANQPGAVRCLNLGRSDPTPALALRAMLTLMQAQEYADIIQTKWEQTEEKPAVIAISIAAFVAIWAASGVIVSASR